VAKHRSSTYREGRSSEWVKIKTRHTVDCVIGGMSAPEGSREPFGALVLGLYRGRDLVHVGNVGSGLSDQLLGELWARWQPELTQHSPFPSPPEADGLHYLEPKPGRVCRVRFDSWTPAAVCVPRLRLPGGG